MVRVLAVQCSRVMRTATMTPRVFEGAKESRRERFIPRYLLVSIVV